MPLFLFSQNAQYPFFRNTDTVAVDLLQWGFYSHVVAFTQNFFHDARAFSDNSFNKKNRQAYIQ